MGLSIHDHDRRRSHRKYVYAVLGRRAGGVSLGVNLNTNSACNWRCVYCEIPDLVFGNAPACELALLEAEFEALLDEVSSPAWLEVNVPDPARRAVKDVSISGNGEPTSCPQFAEVVALLGRVLARRGLSKQVALVLITNGSLAHKPEVQRGLAELSRLGGVVWYKLDSATEEGQARLNGAHAGVARARANLVTAAKLCPTWIQTMALARRGEPPSEHEVQSYVDLVTSLVREGVPVRGIHLYGYARPSHQPEAPELRALGAEWMEAFAARIRAAGLHVQLSL